MDQGRFENVQYLTNLGAQIEAKDENGWTPLHFAVKKGSLEIVKLLVEKGANIDAANNTCHIMANAVFILIRCVRLHTTCCNSLICRVMIVEVMLYALV